MAAQNGTLVLQGLRTGRKYIVDVYAPDAVATLLTFNPTGNAASTSNTSFRVPEDVLIKDISLTAAPTATSVCFTKDGATVIGGQIRWANQLTSLPQRVPLDIPIPAGAFLGGLQA